MELPLYIFSQLLIKINLKISHSVIQFRETHISLYIIDTPVFKSSVKN
jgi:hypothetical protein